MFASVLQGGDRREGVDPVFDRPAYYSHGSLSNPSWAEMRDRLAAAFPDFTAERYEGLHHFQASHNREPERVATALKQLWARAPQPEAASS